MRGGLKNVLCEVIAEDTGQPVEKIAADSERDRWFTAHEAKEDGFVDHVISRINRMASNNS